MKASKPNRDISEQLPIYEGSAPQEFKLPVTDFQEQNRLKNQAQSNIKEMIPKRQKDTRHLRTSSQKQKKRQSSLMQDSV